ncbi:MAG: GTP pyrophosphokinase family protein [Treponema sp.]|nr:GTP pyrophosphokinase family protein [Treponema sp.]
MFKEFNKTELKKLKKLLNVYEIGMFAFLKKINNINDRTNSIYNNNLIEHIKWRLKTPASIAQKLAKLDLELTADNAKMNIKDTAGIRIICPFSKDIHSLVRALDSVPEWNVIEKEDYISNPKTSGYRSFHLIVEVPVYYTYQQEIIPIEVQLRTTAMDFWASIEHKVRYKYREHIPKHLTDELVTCADRIAELDNRMFLIHDIVSLIN